MKRCFKCGENKELSEFHKHSKMADGHLNKCKQCCCRDVRENRAKRRDYYREYDRMRWGSDPDRRAAVRARSKTPAGSLIVAAAKAKWSKNNKLKVNAQAKLRRAVKTGKVERLRCVRCGAAAEAHHEDYSRPLDVVWLCDKHHKERHCEIREAERVNHVLRNSP